MENPTYAYRRADDGSVEANIFDGEIPGGWFDSPARVDDKPADDFTREGIAKMAKKDVVGLLKLHSAEFDGKSEVAVLRDLLIKTMFVEG